jgi:hypothetical protein
MRALVIAAIITSLAVPAFAQAADPNKEAQSKFEEQKKKESEAIEKEYKEMLKRSDRGQPAKKWDPWGNMR